MQFWILSPLFILSTLPTALSLACYMPTRGSSLPIISHCRELANAIIYAGNTPEYRNPRRWGRQLEDSPTSIKLPKLYWLPGRGPSTCAMKLDIEAPYASAEEVFRLSDVGVGTAMILNFCVIEKRKLGVEFLGESKFAAARLLRSDAPVLLEGYGGEMIDLGPGKGELRVADMSVLNATALRLVSNGTDDEVRVQ